MPEFKPVGALVAATSTAAAHEEIRLPKRNSSTCSSRVLREASLRVVGGFVVVMNFWLLGLLPI